MLLSERDTKLLEKAGHDQKDFAYFNKQRYAQLRNRQGFCVFYDAEKHRCKVYVHRPSGCRLYPVIFSEEEGVVIDDLCPKGDTVSVAEVERKARKLTRLLQRVDKEAKKRDPRA